MILVRIISILPAILSLPSGIGSLLPPAKSAAGFGVEEFTLHAQNRDFTDFFMGIPLMCLIGVITMKHIWLAAPAFIFLIVIIAHSVAQYFKIRASWMYLLVRSDYFYYALLEAT